MKISLRNLLQPGLTTWGLLALAFIGIVGVAGCSSSAQNSSPNWQEVNPAELTPSPKVGRLAPDFTLTTLDGASITLSDLRGKTVFINFWATWCPPCRAEMPDIEAIYQEYKDRDVEVIGVDLVKKPDSVRQLVQEGGYNWTFAIDSTGEVANTYLVAGIPTSVFIDRQGVIHAIRIGAITKSAMQTHLDTAMN
ncbi:MAG: TlpA disulfide reductase family protein [Chloroflexota bacterium]|nr:TlpA disulfide reductase family protein [Chloroflexota bacterium]